MNSTKLEDLHPVEILILVFLVVFEAIVTLCTVTPKLWKSKDSVQTAQLKKSSESLKSNTNAPEESQPQSTSTLTAPATVSQASANTRTRSTRSASSRKSKPSELQQKNIRSGNLTKAPLSTMDSLPA